MRTASLLLRYTDMSMSEVARRSGAGLRTSLYYMFQRDYNYPPSQERENAEHDSLWKYRIIEWKCVKKGIITNINHRKEKEKLGKDCF